MESVKGSYALKAPPKRVLVCALGSIGRKYVKLLGKMWPGSELAALRSGKTTTDNCQLENIFFSLQEGMKWGPELVIVTSPAPSHLMHALYFAKEDVPVLIEKPLGSGDEAPDQWEELLTLSQRHKLGVGYVLRNDPCATYLKNAIKLGDLGKLISASFICGSWLPDWRQGGDYRHSVTARRSLGGGALLELSHEIDMALYLLGDLEIESSWWGKISTLELDTEDKSIIIAKNRSSCMVEISLDICTYPPKRSVCLRGELGSLEWDLLNGTIRSEKRGHESEVHQLGISADERFETQIKVFWNMDKGGTADFCSVEEGLKVMRLVNIVKSNNLCLA